MGRSSVRILPVNAFPLHYIHIATSPHGLHLVTDPDQQKRSRQRGLKGGNTNMEMAKHNHLPLSYLLLQMDLEGTHQNCHDRGVWSDRVPHFRFSYLISKVFGFATAINTPAKSNTDLDVQDTATGSVRPLWLLKKATMAGFPLPYILLSGDNYDGDRSNCQVLSHD